MNNQDKRSRLLIFGLFFGLFHLVVVVVAIVFLDFVETVYELVTFHHRFLLELAVEVNLSLVNLTIHPLISLDDDDDEDGDVDFSSFL